MHGFAAVSHLQHWPESSFVLMTLPSRFQEFGSL
jgi:hypothetical protein